MLIKKFLLKSYIAEGKSTENLKFGTNNNRSLVMDLTRID